MKNTNPKKAAYILFIVFLGYSFFGNLRLFLKARSNLTTAQALLTQKKDEKAKLESEVTKIGKQAYLERVARDTLGLSRENEIVFVLPPEEELKKISPRLLSQNKETDTSLPQIPHWQEWLKLFI